MTSRKSELAEQDMTPKDYGFPKDKDIDSNGLDGVLLAQLKNLEQVK
jgi:hypothetical protein